MCCDRPCFYHGSHICSLGAVTGPAFIMKSLLQSMCCDRPCFYDGSHICSLGAVLGSASVMKSLLQSRCCDRLCFCYEVTSAVSKHAVMLVLLQSCSSVDNQKRSL